jgi:hypothetical protein
VTYRMMGYSVTVAWPMLYGSRSYVDGEVTLLTERCWLLSKLARVSIEPEWAPSAGHAGSPTSTLVSVP